MLEYVIYLSRFTGWMECQHRVLVIDGVNVPLPFNFNSMERLLPEGPSVRIQEKLLERYAYGSRVPIPEISGKDDPDMRFLAGYVYRKVFLNYTMKQWGLRPEEIDPTVTEESQKMYREYRGLAEEIGDLTLLGRLAEYRYYDMDDVVKRALDVFEGEVR
ncbi:hypothetical protein [Methanothermobacter sp. K4]|uniref:hypothetical protein n=1 Tax=Methanothermobacter sp. K4 TaxID=2913262 RepID=UPI001EDBEC46|nr:hypothetical protein [Methanothermobacter sp. K4]MCG2828370.1 hypothetical protein [Methanothermobacter sp. K4]